MQKATRSLLYTLIVASLAAGCARTSLPSTEPAPGSYPQYSNLAIPATGTTLPVFTSSNTFGGSRFTYTMVGTNPVTNPGSTTIRTIIIPLRLTFSDRTVTDPTIALRETVASPIFRTASILGMTTQYGDAVMRAEFWNFVKTKNYHVLLANPPAVLTPVPETIPAADGAKHTSSDGVTTEAINFAYFEENIEEPLLQKHSNPATLTIFVMGDTRVLEQNGHCCFNGYHDAIQVVSGGPSFPALWGYVASKAPTQLSHVSHEVAEWLNDPLYLAHANLVPRWVFPSGGCGSTQLEVGDPLVLTRFTVNGFTLQDVSLFSWFARNSPSVGISGRYDLLGKVTKPAGFC